MRVNIGQNLESQVKITIQEDGTIKVDSTKLLGDDAGILAELNRMTESVGGDLKVEKHVHKHTFGISQQKQIKVGK